MKTKPSREELARRGKISCKKCSHKLIMYYVARCPICDFKGKDRKNLLLMQYFIEAKHGITLRDYAAKKHGVKDSFTHNFNHKTNWENTHFPIPEKYTTNPVSGRCVNEKGMKWCDSPKGRKFFDDRRTAYRKAPDGECKEIERQDWWCDCICDNYDIRNDSVHRINFGHILGNCTEDWQREITQLFVDEFGKKDIVVEISW